MNFSKIGDQSTLSGGAEGKTKSLTDQDEFGLHSKIIKK